MICRSNAGKRAILVPCTERRRLKMCASVLEGRTLLAIFRIELGAGGWKVGEQSVEDLKHTGS